MQKQVVCLKIMEKMWYLSKNQDIMWWLESSHKMTETTVHCTDCAKVEDIPYHSLISGVESGRSLCCILLRSAGPTFVAWISSSTYSIWGTSTVLVPGMQFQTLRCVAGHVTRHARVSSNKEGPQVLPTGSKTPAHPPKCMSEKYIWFAQQCAVIGAVVAAGASCWKQIA